MLRHWLISREEERLLLYGDSAWNVLLLGEVEVPGGRGAKGRKTQVMRERFLLHTGAENLRNARYNSWGEIMKSISTIYPLMGGR